MINQVEWETLSIRDLVNKNQIVLGNKWKVHLHYVLVHLNKKVMHPNVKSYCGALNNVWISKNKL